jgi:histone H3/H4
MAEEERNYWRRCSTCKTPVDFDAAYFRCSVSTCNRKRAPYVFCSVACWDAHQADARHRDAGAEHASAPTRTEWEKEQNEERERAAAPGPGDGSDAIKPVRGATNHEVLIVASRLKDYLNQRAGMSTSDRVLRVLSDHVRELLDRSIEAAARDSRKTVMDRDLAPLVARDESRATGTRDPDDRPDEIMVVVSKLKQYVKARSGMNTSDSVALVMSAHLRRMARQAIRHAIANDRKTVLDRDFVAVGAG